MAYTPPHETPLWASVLVRTIVIVMVLAFSALVNAIIEAEWPSRRRWVPWVRWPLVAAALLALGAAIRR